MVSDLLFAFDLETETKNGHGLEPLEGKITSAAIYWGPLDPEDDMEEGAVSFDDPCEERLLLGVRDFFQSPWTPAGTIVGWNSSGFDLPFFLTRAKILDMPLFDFDARVSEARKPKYGALKGCLGGYSLAWGRHDHADIWPAFTSLAESAGIKSGLKPVSEFLGLSPINVDRAKMEDLTVASRSAYNVSDVEVTFRCAQKIAELYEDGILDYEFDHWRDSHLFEEEAA